MTNTAQQFHRFVSDIQSSLALFHFQRLATPSIWSLMHMLILKSAQRIWKDVYKRQSAACVMTWGIIYRCWNILWQRIIWMMQQNIWLSLIHIWIYSRWYRKCQRLWGYVGVRWHVWLVSTCSWKEKIVDLAKKDAQDNVYMGNAFMNLRKAEVSKVAPDRDVYKRQGMEPASLWWGGKRV